MGGETGPGAQLAYGGSMDGRGLDPAKSRPKAALERDSSRADASEIDVFVQAIGSQRVAEFDRVAALEFAHDLAQGLAEIDRRTHG